MTPGSSTFFLSQNAFFSREQRHAVTFYSETPHNGRVGG